MKKIWLLIAIIFTAQISFAEPINDVSPDIKIMPKVRREAFPEPIVPAEPIPLPKPDAELNQEPFTEKSLHNAFFLFQLQQDLKDAKDDYLDLNSTISATQKKLDSAQEIIFSLKEQITLFQEQIDESEKKVLNVMKQISLREQDIEKLSAEIESRKLALIEQKKLLQDYMNLQYVQENLYFEDGKFSPAKILLADQSVSNTFQTIQTMSLLQETGGQLLNSLTTTTRTLEGMQLNLEGKKKRLDQLKEKLVAEQESIQDKKLAKAQLLKETRGDEELYRELIAQSISQQEESILEIRALQDNMRYVQRKLKDSGADISISELRDLVDQRSKEFYEYQFQPDNDATFQWPVSPSRGISAYFRDPGYRARFGIGHNAIDIPTLQGTPVHAAKDGYIYKAKNNGYGYNYIILSHKDGFTSVYGHLSELLVSENDFVTAGQVIGMSGGTPGTKGAGYLTTGAHLHFEILKDGKYQDPLDYLSLTRLSLESLPSKYAGRVEEQKRLLPKSTSEMSNEESLDNEMLMKRVEEDARVTEEIEKRMKGEETQDEDAP